MRCVRDAGSGRGCALGSSRARGLWRRCAAGTTLKKPVHAPRATAVVVARDFASRTRFFVIRVRDGTCRRASLWGDPPRDAPLCAFGPDSRDGVPGNPIPQPCSRRVATDYGAARGFNYAAEHVGASRSSPPAPPPKPASSRGAEPRGGFRLFSLPYATDSTFVRVGAAPGISRAPSASWSAGATSSWAGPRWIPTRASPQAIQSVSAPTSSACGSEIRSRLYTTNLAAAAAAAARGAAADARRNASPFAHGCLEGHLLAGEEAFVLERREDDSVWYGVNTFSRPAHPLALVGYPAVRALQWKFAKDSTRAVREGVRGESGGVCRGRRAAEVTRMRTGTGTRTRTRALRFADSKPGENLLGGHRTRRRIRRAWKARSLDLATRDLSQSIVELAGRGLWASLLLGYRNHGVGCSLR